MATFRLLLLRFGLVLAIALPGSAMVPVSAAAQGFGFFSNLFGGGGFGRPQPARPAYPGYGDSYNAPRGRANDGFYAPSRRRATRKAPSDAPKDVAGKESGKEKTPAKDASIFVDVYGDTMGQMLANGLDDAFEDRDEVGVVHKARGPTGIANEATFDWTKAIADQLSGHEAQAEAPHVGDGAKIAVGEGSGSAKGKPDEAAAAKARPATSRVDVAVMMIGSNDNQPIQVDGKTLKFGTPEWNAVYAKRVTTIIDLFRAHKIPLIWVGVPITKDDDFADAMAGLNEIYRDAANKAGSTFVDTWEAFSDDDGDFSVFGPDINGQTVRLRAADGINFTKAGGRKLAHFVEAHVVRALEGKMPVPQLPTVATEPGKEKAAAVHAEAGPIRNLNEVPSATNGVLARFEPATDKAGQGTPAAETNDADKNLAETAGAAIPPIESGSNVTNRVGSIKPNATAIPRRADQAHWTGASADDP